MAQLTVRGVDDAMKHALEQEAGRRNTSVNRLVVAILRQALGLAAGPRRAQHHDLDHLAGTWTPKRAKDFDLAVAEQRGIDEDLWR